MLELNAPPVRRCCLEMMLRIIWIQNIRVVIVRFVCGMGFYQSFPNISVLNTLLVGMLPAGMLPAGTLPRQMAATARRSHDANSTSSSVTNVGRTRNQ